MGLEPSGATFGRLYGEPPFTGESGTLVVPVPAGRFGDWLPPPLLPPIVTLVDELALVPPLRRAVTVTLTGPVAEVATLVEQVEPEQNEAVDPVFDAPPTETPYPVRSVSFPRFHRTLTLPPVAVANSPLGAAGAAFTVKGRVCRSPQKPRTLCCTFAVYAPLISAVKPPLNCLCCQSG